MRGRVLQTSIQPTHQNAQKRSFKRRVPLSAEERADAMKQRQVAAKAYSDAIDGLWTKIQEEAGNIAITHRKSVRKVSSDIHMTPTVSLGKHSKMSAWNAFLWKKRQLDKENSIISGSMGKEVLQELIKQHQKEYHVLAEEEKSELVKEYEQHKALLARGTHISARARANDAVATLGCIENMVRNVCEFVDQLNDNQVGLISQLDGLRSRAGVESQLFSTRSSIDVPLKSVTYSTAGVENFVESTLKLDKTDILGRMEGYALQGLKLKGAAGNYNERRAALRAHVRDIINHNLRQTSGIPKAKMEWKYYFRNVVKRYSVIIEGWPPEIPFVNLSDTSSSIDTLKNLLRKWKQGSTYWKKLTQEELEKLEDERDAQIGGGNVQAPAPRRTRSDKGKKRRRHVSDDRDDDNSDVDAGDDRIPEEASDDEWSNDSGQRRTKRAKRAR